MRLKRNYFQSTKGNYIGITTMVRKQGMRSNKKLILNQMDKTTYVVHIKALQFYLQKGMKLKQVHRGVKFKQRCWLKPWIDFNTEKGQVAKSDFEKDMFKLDEQRCLWQNDGECQKPH